MAEIYHAKDNELLKNHGEQVYESQVKNTRGELHDVVYYKKSFISGDKFWLVGVVLDISERKKADAVLRVMALRQERIVEGTRAGTWEWNVQTGETVFNDRWAQIIGYTLEELAPVSIKTWEALCHPDDMKRSAKLLEQCFSGELSYYDCECQMKHKDGHWVWVHDRGCIMTRNEDGKPLMMFGTHMDITLRKNTEGALQDKMNEIKRMNKFMTDREFRVIEVKKEVNELCKELGRPSPYNV